MPGKVQESTPDNMLRNILVGVSILAGLLYPVLHNRFGPVADVAVKGLAVGALAISATLTSGPGQKWLAAVMACGAIGDMLLEIPGELSTGGSVFAVGHLIAIVFYLRNLRSGLWSGDALVAAALIAYGIAVPSLVLPETESTGALTLYSVLLCAMAAASYFSRFPKRFVTIGALLFVLSDTFLVLRMAGLEVNGAGAHGNIVWYSYYAGQLLIFIGVSMGLTRGFVVPAGRRS